MSQSFNEAAAIGAAVTSALGAYRSLGGFVPLGPQRPGVGEGRNAPCAGGSALTAGYLDRVGTMIEGL